MRCWVRVCCVVAWCAAGEARAQSAEEPEAPPTDQPQPPPASEPEPAPGPGPGPEPAPAPPPPPAPETAPVVVDAGYPLAYAARPLLLPTNAVEGSALLRYSDVLRTDELTRITADPRVRVGLPRLEVEVATQLLLHDSTSEPFVMVDSPLLSSIYGAARAALDPDLAVGAELAIVGPTTDIKTFSPRAVVASRRHFTPRSALDLGFATGIDRTSASMTQGPSPIIPSQFVASVQAKVIAQAAPNFAAELAATLSYYRPYGDENPATSAHPVTVQQYSLRFIASLSNALDIVFGTEVPAQTVRVAFVGIAARRLP